MYEKQPLLRQGSGTRTVDKGYSEAPEQDQIVGNITSEPAEEKLEK
jgi:hypothetical protein